jgi:Putative sensor
VRPLLAAERKLANALLGAEIPDAPLSPGGDGWLGRAKAYWTDVSTWRGTAYLLARLPLGVATFSVATAAYGTALYLSAAPIVAPFDSIDLDFWRIDTAPEGLAILPLGLLLLVAAGWISEGMAAASGGVARWGVR